MSKKSDKPYTRVEKILSRQINHEVHLQTLKDEINRRLVEGDFTLRFENVSQGDQTGPHKMLKVIVALGSDKATPTVTPIILLSADLRGEEIMKILDDYPAATECFNTGVVCGDKTIRISKIVSG